MMEIGEHLTGPQRVVLAVDTSNRAKAGELATLASNAGAEIIKQGLELSTALEMGMTEAEWLSSWSFCSENAAEHGLEWVADAKLHDIPNTTAAAVENILSTEHPPVAVTIHAHSGVDAMKAAQDVAGERGVVMLGVTELTSIKEQELKERYGFVLAKLGIEEFLQEGVTIEEILKEADVRGASVSGLLHDARKAGIGGAVAAARELKDIVSDPVLKGLMTMIPGTRSKGADVNDQQNVMTPFEAMEMGATLLVIGRQVTKADDPAAAFVEVGTEMQSGLDARRAA